MKIKQLRSDTTGIYIFVRALDADDLARMLATDGFTRALAADRPAGVLGADGLAGGVY